MEPVSNVGRFTRILLIIIGIICIIGIILRWDYVVEGVKKGFNFYSETSE